MTTTTYCPTCHGSGSVPTGGVAFGSAVSMSWGDCKTCGGTGTHVECDRCLGTGIDLEAPVNLASPPPCPCCHAQPVAA